MLCFEFDMFEKNTKTQAEKVNVNDGGELFYTIWTSLRIGFI